MYTADLVWFTPLPRTAGNTLGASTTRGNDGTSDDPSSSICVHSIASRKQTTASPLKIPISTASSRKKRSSRIVKTSCVQLSQRERTGGGAGVGSEAGSVTGTAGAAPSGDSGIGVVCVSLNDSPCSGCAPAAIARDHHLAARRILWPLHSRSRRQSASLPPAGPENLADCVGSSCHPSFARLRT